MAAMVLALVGCDSQAAREVPTPAAGADAEAAPAFELTDLAGQQISLRAFARRPVIIHFWAPWVVVCRAESSALQRAYGERQGGGLVILGVAEQATAAEVRRFVQELGLTYPALLDPEQRVYALFGAEGIPTSVFLDRGGRIRYRQTGLLDGETLTRELARIMK